MAVKYTEEQLHTIDKSILIQMLLQSQEQVSTLIDAISKWYRFVPAKVEVEEYHIGVYASKIDGHMVKAKHLNIRVYR